jgi:predicted GIY-YIG superfamily endonuclease
VKRLILLGAVALFAGCIARHQRPPEPTRAEQLLEVVTRARVAAASGQRDEADAILARFVEANPSTPEGREAAYWRAILRLESATSRADRDAAQRDLDVYLADTAMTAHMSEARILRHLLAAVDSTLQATDSANAAARQAATAREEELKKEIQALKEQLVKTNDELDRIKKRLGSRP